MRLPGVEDLRLAGVRTSIVYRLPWGSGELWGREAWGSYVFFGGPWGLGFQGLGFRGLGFRILGSRG